MDSSGEAQIPSAESGSGRTGFRKPRDLPGLALIALVVAVVFLPAALQLTYYRDDWYYMLDGLSAGPDVFVEMFSVDRPARGVLFASLFSVFGASPLAYNFLSFGLRLGSALAAYWLFSQLWPGKRSAPVWGALLFAVYPGYLWWVAGVEYLPMMLSLVLQVLSIGLTLSAVRASGTGSKIAYWMLSILAGWAYLALVEYAIGIELFRFLCVYSIVGQRRTHGSTWERTKAAVGSWLPAAAIPVGFLLWRLLLFENRRAETDLATQFGVLVDQPLLTSARWAVSLFRSVTNLVFFSWAVPLTENLYDLRLGDIGRGFLSALIVAASIAGHRLWNFRRHRREDPPTPGASARVLPTWVEALGIGLLGGLGAAIPVVAANRTITFQAYSHYSLPGSLAAAVVVVAGLQLLRPRLLALGFLTGLLCAATLTHFAIATKALTEQRETAAFWWQVAWRAPGLAPGTTLFVRYPSFDYGDDASAVWGPANLVYAPSPGEAVPVEYAYSAVGFPDTSLEELTSGVDRGRGAYRTHSVPIDFGKLLVALQTAPGGCVRIIDGQSPLASPDDPPEFLVAEPYSNLDVIDPGGPGASVPTWLFGPEPDHGWCHSFQKAELALQTGDSAVVAALGDEALARGLKPLSVLEWVPFAQGYAIQGRAPELEIVASKIGTDPAAGRQACLALFENRPPEVELPEVTSSLAHALFCD